MSSIQIRTFTGNQAADFIPELARLRIEIFRDFPYLYDGSMEYEGAYLERLLQCPESILVVALDADRVIGVSTGLPLSAETDNVKQPWVDQGVDISKVFYYGESVLKKQYRGRGLGVRFFEEREHWARSLKRFDILSFCAVIRPQYHPMRPSDYLPLDAFWKKRGFVKTDSIICHMSWLDIGETEESKKSLQFWIKPLL